MDDTVPHNKDVHETNSTNLEKDIHFKDSENLQKEEETKETAESVDKIDQVHKEQKNYLEALENLKKSLQKQQNSHDEGDHIHIDSAYLLVIKKTHSNWNDSNKCFIASLEMWPGDNENIAQNLYEIGRIYQEMKNYKESYEYFVKCLAMYQNLHVDDHINVAVSHHKVAWLLMQQGQYKDSLKHFEKCLEMLGRLYKDKKDSRIARSLYNIGLVYAKQFNKTESIHYFKSSLSMYEELGKEKFHEDITRCNNCLKIVETDNEKEQNQPPAKKVCICQ